MVCLFPTASTSGIIRTTLPLELKRPELEAHNSSPFIETLKKVKQPPYTFICGAGVEPSPLLLQPITGLLYQPWTIDGDDDCGVNGGMNDWLSQSRHCPHFMGSESSLPCSQQPSTVLSSAIHNLSPHQPYLSQYTPTAFYDLVIQIVTCTNVTFEIIVSI
jgi:hypothetical protein